MVSDEYLIDEIDAFVIASGMKETTFGRLAVNDGKFVARLRAKPLNVTLRTVKRVRRYIARERVLRGLLDPPRPKRQ